MISLYNLSLILWKIWLAFILLAVLACLEAWVHYHRRRGIDIGGDENVKYYYFVQSIHDHESQVLGYELLLREYNSRTGKWELPAKVTEFPLTRAVQGVSEIVRQLKPEIKFVTVNLTMKQIQDFRIERFVSWAQSILQQRSLIIELNAREILKCNFLQRWRLKHQLKIIASLNVPVMIDDIDSSQEMYELLQQFLPYIKFLKFQAQDFNKSANHWIEVTLGDWQAQAKHYQLQMILERVEEKAQNSLADQLRIPYRQGYLYDKPHAVNNDALK